MPKNLEGYCSGKEGHLTHTVITGFGYSTIMLEVSPNQLGLFSSMLFAYFCTVFLVNLYFFWETFYIGPNFL